MGGGKDVEVGPMSLCVAHGLKGWTGNQLGEDKKNAKYPGFLLRGTGLGRDPLWESAL